MLMEGTKIPAGRAEEVVMAVRMKNTTPKIAIDLAWKTS